MPNGKVRKELHPGALDGISEDQVAQHWTLYEGYCKNAAALEEKTAALAQKGDFGPEFAELKRRLGWELNGVRLHEYYFEQLKKGQSAPGESSELVKQLKKAFGGLSAWRKELTAVAKMRGIGWAILYCDPRTGHLLNAWITSHEEGHPAGCLPILVLDVWEHAYMVDWGAGGRGEYIEAFFKNVDWSLVEKRHRDATAGLMTKTI